MLALSHMTYSNTIFYNSWIYHLRDNGAACAVFLLGRVLFAQNAEVFAYVLYFLLMEGGLLIAVASLEKFYKENWIISDSFSKTAKSLVKII